MIDMYKNIDYFLVAMVMMLRVVVLQSENDTWIGPNTNRAPPCMDGATLA